MGGEFGAEPEPFLAFFALAVALAFTIEKTTTVIMKPNIGISSMLMTITFRCELWLVYAV